MPVIVLVSFGVEKGTVEVPQLQWDSIWTRQRSLLLFSLTTMMKVLVMTTTIGLGAASSSCGSCHRLWGNCEVDTACSGVEQIVAHAADH